MRRLSLVPSEPVPGLPDGTNKELVVKRILDEDGREMESAPHPKQKIFVELEEGLELGWLLRRKEEV